MPISRRFRLVIALSFVVGTAFFVAESSGVARTNIVIGGLGLLAVVAVAFADGSHKDFEHTTREVGAQNDLLAEQARLKDHFIAKVAHDLRTPLTSIVGYTELLVDGSAGELEPEQKQFLQVVGRNAHRLERMVDDLLLMAKIDAGTLRLEKAPFDLADLLIESVASALPLAEDKGMEITIHHPLGTVIVNGDRKRLGQAVEQLLYSAITSSPTASRVELRSDLTSSEALISVTDSGSEISPEEQSRLFDKYYLCAPGAGSGRGFGLSMVSHVAQAHQGSVKVSSELGVGSTITMALPRLDTQRLLANSGAMNGE